MITARRTLFTASLALLPLTLAFAPRADEIGFAPEDDSTTTRSLAIDVALFFDDLRVVVDGQEMPVPMDELGSGLVFNIAMDVADRFVKSSDGRPIELVRTYESLSMQGGHEGETESMDEVDEIVDKPIRFLWDDEEGEHVASWADTTATASDELLESLDVDMDFRMLLPSGEVSKGDTWTVKGTELAWLFLPGGMPAGSEEADDDEMFAMIEESLEAQMEESFRDFEVVCTYNGAREEGDTRVGDITFTYRGAATIDLGDIIDQVVADQGGEMGIEADVTASVKLEFDGTGGLLWDLGTRRAHSMHMASEMSMLVDVEADIAAAGEEHSIEASMELSGNGKWNMTTK